MAAPSLMPRKPGRPDPRLRDRPAAPASPCMWATCADSCGVPHLSGCGRPGQAALYRLQRAAVRRRRALAAGRMASQKCPRNSMNRKAQNLSLAACRCGKVVLGALGPPILAGTWSLQKKKLPRSRDVRSRQVAFAPRRSIPRREKVLCCIEKTGCGCACGEDDLEERRLKPESRQGGRRHLLLRGDVDRFHKGHLVVDLSERLPEKLTPP